MSTWNVTLLDMRTDDIFYLDVEAEDRSGALREAERQTGEAGRPGKGFAAKVAGTTRIGGGPDSEGPRPPLRVLFRLGEPVMTPGAVDALKAADTKPFSLLDRHLTGDWGELDPHDVKVNEAGLRDGERLMSVYVLKTGVRVWVITERDRSVTTILLPEEY